MSLQSRVFPVLLIRDRGLVKTRRFGDDRYVGDPLNAVKIFNEKEVDELAIFDIDATVQGREPDFEELRKIAAESRMPLCYGGGVNSAATAARLVAIGYEKISVSAAAVDRPALIREMAERVGRQSVVLTIDVVREGLLGGYAVRTRNATRKNLEIVGVPGCRFQYQVTEPTAEKLHRFEGDPRLGRPRSCQRDPPVLNEHRPPLRDRAEKRHREKTHQRRGQERDQRRDENFRHSIAGWCQENQQSDAAGRDPLGEDAPSAAEKDDQERDQCNQPGLPARALIWSEKIYRIATPARRAPRRRGVILGFFHGWQVWPGCMIG